MEIHPGGDDARAPVASGNGFGGLERRFVSTMCKRLPELDREWAARTEREARRGRGSDPGWNPQRYSFAGAAVSG